MSESVLREPRDPRARREPRGRRGQRRRADRRDHARGWSPCSSSAGPTGCWWWATSTRRWPARSPRSSSGCPLAHVEAGLRSFDRDHARGDQPDPHRCDLRPALHHRAGRPTRTSRARAWIRARVHFVGNVMIDTLFRYRERARESTILERPRAGAAAATPRSPCTGRATWTRADALGRMLDAIARDPGGDPGGLPGAPAHARAARSAATAGWRPCAGLRLVEPLPYLDFVQLMANARCVLTDSGGIQEETTALRRSLPHPAREHRAADHRDPGHQPHRGRGPRRASSRPGGMSPPAAGRRASFPSSGTARRPSASSACSFTGRRR